LYSATWALIQRKCDGARPKCWPCTQRGRSCGYRNAGQQRLRAAAMHARISSLERMVDDLQSQARSNVEPGAPTDVSRQLDVLEPNIASRRGNRPEATNQSLPAGTQTNSASASASLSSAEISFSEPGQLRFLDGATTTQATDVFFSSSGKLFHVFTRQEVNRYHEAVFGTGDRPVIRRGPDLCRLMAVASMGTQYLAGSFPDHIRNGFYEIAKSNLDDLIEQHPLDAIKASALLCMFNVMLKSTVSLCYAGKRNQNMPLLIRFNDMF